VVLLASERRGVSFGFRPCCLTGSRGPGQRYSGRAVRRLRKAAGGILAGLALALISGPGVSAAEQSGAAAACPDADLVPASDNLARVEAATLCLMNRERRAARLVALRRSAALDRSAAYHSIEMVRYHFLAHEAPGRPTLLTRIRGYGYFDGVADGLYAENVGAGATSNGTAHALMDAWMASPPHRANVLYPKFRKVGIAAVLAPSDPAFFADYPSTVYTTDFGRRYMRRRCAKRAPAASPNQRTATSQRSYCRRRHR
jgi:uncharacterized protein YkwD